MTRHTLLAGALAVALAAPAAASAQAPAPPPPAAQALTGVSTAVARFAGIPARGNRIGREAAPVTVTIYADLASPLTAQLSERVLPAIVRGYVRTGRVRMVLRPIAHIGAGSGRAALGTDAAARQAMAWPMLGVLMHNQGAETAGWPADATLTEAATRLGMDPARWLRDYAGAAVGAAHVRDEALWRRSFAGAPAAEITGPRGAGQIVGAPGPRTFARIIGAVS